VFGSEVRFLHCAATVILERDESDLNTIGYPEQEKRSLSLYFKLPRPVSGKFYFMKYKYTKILILILIIIASATFIFSKRFSISSIKNSEVVSSKAVEEINFAKNREESKPVKNQSTQPKANQDLKKDEPNQIEVSLKVLGKDYKTRVNIGDTVLDAMNKIASEKENNFSFKTKDYGDLGSFVSEINGVEGKPGEYWLYYLNDKKASLGISKNVLKQGDSILWKQEAF
jgi:hypothetical protein